MAPNELRVCVIGAPGCTSAPGDPLHRHRLTWKEPNSGDVVRYTISRARAVANPAGSVVAVVTGATGLPVTLVVNLTTPFAQVGTTNPATTTFIDNEELPNGQYFVYVVTATHSSGLTEAISPYSNYAAVSAINAAPVALAGALTTNEDTPAAGILVATDVDSASVPRTIVANAAGVGTAAVTNPATGAFAYALETDAYGADALTFKVFAGTYSADGGLPVPMSANSNVAQVVITVNPVNDVPSFIKGGNQGLAPLVLEDAGAQTVANWATNIKAGPLNETNGLCVPLSAAVCQQTVTFQVTNNSNTALFSAQPAIAPNGTLTYTPAPNANGSATVTVRVIDNGGIGLRRDRHQRIADLHDHRHAGERRAVVHQGRRSGPRSTRARGCRSADGRELGNQHQRRAAERNQWPVRAVVGRRLSTDGDLLGHE